jgi:Fe2+ or Zn2+ uptake regulation protein
MSSTVSLLRSAGLKSTATRRVVLDALAAHPHATAADIAEAVTRSAVVDGGARAMTSLSRQGLYNVLDDLTRVGLVRCIEPSGSATRYELRVGDNHHHLVCRSCGRVADVDCTVGAAPCLAPIDSTGFSTVDEAEVTWWGECDDCTQAAAVLPVGSGVGDR